MKEKKKIKLSRDDRIFYIAVNIIMAIVLIVVLWPLIFIVSSSFSSKEAVLAGRVFLLPVDFSLEGYKAVFSTGEVLTGYRNTIFYTVVGTFLNVLLTMVGAYPLSRKDLPYRKVLMFLFTFTMIFSGGMIPTYILVSELGLLNSPLAMILPGALSVYNLIIARSFIETNIPHEVFEAAVIDGCSDFKYFCKVLFPLSGSVVAVLTLYYAVAHWNSYFNAFLYITDSKLYPLQLVLRNILIANQVDSAMVTDFDAMTSKQGLADLMKYSLIVVSSVPVLILYPFVQKHFVKGVMIGSVKG
ncbi:MAG: carbohydrate ABC transporter permease [Clostridia bacterium]|nr:carbohydrate ABC transporter permease [Clostridia bacterium]